jgi:hypothetical protein
LKSLEFASQIPFIIINKNLNRRFNFYKKLKNNNLGFSTRRRHYFCLSAMASVQSGFVHQSRGVRSRRQRRRNNRPVVTGPEGSNNARIRKLTSKFVIRTLGVNSNYMIHDYQELLRVFISNMSSGVDLTLAIREGGFAGHILYQKIQNLLTKDQALKILNIAVLAEKQYIRVPYKTALQIEVLIQLCDAAGWKPSDLQRLLEHHTDTGYISNVSSEFSDVE